MPRDGAASHFFEPAAVFGVENNRLFIGTRDVRGKKRTNINKRNSSRFLLPPPSAGDSRRVGEPLSFKKRKMGRCDRVCPGPRANVLPLA